MKQLFRGGIHPNDGKALSRGGAPVPAPAPSRVIIPMSQHIGAPCSPLVKVGDTVKLGQKIGDGEGVCSPVHASVSGTVAAVEQLPIPGGRKSVCVVIDSDGKDTPDPAIKPRATHKGMTPAELAAIVREAGICGMGGAAYPTNSKILSTAGKTDTMIINACECEPYITSDDTVMCTWPEKVILGARILADVIGEVCTLALLIGLVYLLWRKVISWRIPVAYIGAVAVLTLVFNKGDDAFLWMLYSVMGGGVMLGAIFMATDYVTSPALPAAQLVYGLGCGVLTVIFRYFGLFPEGVTYAILIMNACAWALDKAVPVKRFGVAKGGAGK